MKVALKYVDFGVGVSGAGIHITTYDEENTSKKVTGCWMTRLGIVIATDEGRQLLVKDGWLCAEAKYDFDWTDSADLKRSEKQIEERHIARRAVKDAADYVMIEPGDPTPEEVTGEAVT